MNPNYTAIEHCRVCGKDNIENLNVVKSYYLMNLNQNITVSHKVCLDCQFIFQGEYVGDSFLEFYYKSSPMLRRKDPTEFEIDQNVRQADFLTRHIDIYGISVLEIGAAAGAFLSHLNNEFSCKTYFNELSDEAVSVLSLQDGLVNYDDTLRGTKMDLVVLRHVLEHIFDLDGFLNYLRTILSNGSHLFVEVPDWSWLDSHTDPLIFEHLNQFNTNNLIHLMKRNGWQCEALEKSIVADDPATPNRVQRMLFVPNDVPVLSDKKIVNKFSEFIEDTYGKVNSAINKLISKPGGYETIALYPASHLIFSALNESKLAEANIMGIFDIDIKKHGKVIKGIEVFPVEKLIEASPSLILVFSMAYEREIRNSFSKMGLTADVISITQLME